MIAGGGNERVTYGTRGEREEEMRVMVAKVMFLHFAMGCRPAN
jgi:hypothetical protein